MKIYEAVLVLPKHELFCLSAQMRRSAYSVPMNLVEGNTKISRKEQLHFIEYAEASLEELHYQIVLARDLRYFPENVTLPLTAQIERVGSLLYRFKLGVRQRL